MVESVDGSFVPWSFVARAPGDAIAVRLTNNHDLSYLVSSYRYTSLLSADQVVGNCQDGLVLVFHLVVTLSHSLVIPRDRHSCSADPNGRFPFAELYLSGIASGRC